MKLKSRVLSAIAGLVMATSAVPALATPIIGGISFSDGFEATGLTTSIVSQLNTINVNNGPGVTQASGCTSAFGTCTPPPVVFGAASDFTIGTVPVQAYTYGNFTFVITGFGTPTRNGLNCVDRTCTDSLIFTGTGTVDDNGGPLDQSNFSISWTANGSCLRNFGSVLTQCDSDVTASWSASISAAGFPRTPEPTPEPATLALLGLGLVGLGFTIKKRK